jgi:hypothetical protein
VGIIRELAVVRQAQVIDQLPAIACERRVAYAPVARLPPDWWAESLIPLEDVEAVAAARATS